ncbi:MAG: hypothetical protein KGZ64_07575 [Thermaerobacter sp.]|nr:hypothetical protein [Thermaerobacter sp.]
MLKKLTDDLLDLTAYQKGDDATFYAAAALKCCCCIKCCCCCITIEV